MPHSLHDHQHKSKRVVVGLGEILWDIFPDGPRCGGAPANFACIAAGLAEDRFEVVMASSVGSDDLGDRAIESLTQHNVKTSCVQRASRPTGQVLVELDSKGVARYQFAVDAAWDHLEWSDDLERLAARTDAVCFGTLGQRSLLSRETIQRFLKAGRPVSLRILDLNVRKPFVSESVIVESLKCANVLKLNDEELPVLATLCGFLGSDQKVMQRIAELFDLQAFALTRGDQGALLGRGREISEHSGTIVDVVDTVGAGDAFTAVLTLGLLEGLDLDVINRTACEVAAFVCSQSGGTPKISRQIGSW
ncbi:MAG: carbohydrate kinase [Planctomycetota bacterium]|nr:MAG: carbohydrate kinase [Planctomycetota bacterium]